MRKSYLLVLGFVLVFIAVVVFCRSIGERPLAAYKAQLRAQGEALTFAELTATLSPSLGESTAALTNTAARLGPCRVLVTNRVAFRLILPPPGAPSWRAAAPPPILEETDEPVVISWQECGARVSARAATLAELREFLKAPAPHAHFGSNWLMRATPVKEVRSCASWLYLAALVDLRAGHSAAAFTNLQTLTALANFHREESQLISHLTRGIVGELALAAMRDLLASDEVPPVQWANLQRAWESVDFLAGLERATLGERCFFLQAVQQGIAQQERARKTLLWSLYRRTAIDNDVLFGLRNLQGTVECARALRQNRPWPEVNARLRDLDGEVKAKFSRPQRYFYLFSLVAVPSFSGTFGSFVEVETQRRLAVTAIALKRYHLTHGEWPKTLGGLVPQFLPAVPLDCMTGKPLGYELRPDGPQLFSAAERVGK